MLSDEAVLGWLYGKLNGISAVTALLGGDGGKMFLAGQIPPEVAPPYLTVYQRSLVVAHPIGGPVTAQTYLFDVALWNAGTQTDAILSAYEAIDAALADTGSDLYQDAEGARWLVSSAVVGRLPAAPPPQQSGDPRMVRLGRQYEVFVGAAG